jgi:hypothetical protein
MWSPFQYLFVTWNILSQNFGGYEKNEVEDGSKYGSPVNRPNPSTAHANPTKTFLDFSKYSENSKSFLDYR